MMKDGKEGAYIEHHHLTDNPEKMAIYPFDGLIIWAGLAEKNIKS
jgi:hypothetical protein